MKKNLKNSLEQFRLEAIAKQELPVMEITKEEMHELDGGYRVPIRPFPHPPFPRPQPRIPFCIPWLR